ncbi:uncharacterized protein LOC136090827 [Hydra vulgaris]|uniref:Uncharacterized protein LOC136090827 n=1 Tax=Hydra vulgaris TaxID=6087 RepID=A0ABM4DHB9_HYDVU
MSLQGDTIFKCFKESLLSVLKKVDNLAKDSEEIKRGLTFVGDQMETKVSKVDSKMAEIKETMVGIKSFHGKLSNDSNENKRKTVDLEDRNRRNNLRIVGIKEANNETFNDVLKKVSLLFKEDLEIADPVVIERAHCVGKFNGKPRTIVCKILNWQDKENILSNARKLKGKNIFINEDYSDETMRIRKELFVQAKIHRGNGKYAKVIYNRLVVREMKNENEGVKSK